MNRIEDDELRQVLAAMPSLTVIGFYGESLRVADSDSGWYVGYKINCYDYCKMLLHVQCFDWGFFIP